MTNKITASVLFTALLTLPSTFLLAHGGESAPHGRSFAITQVIADGPAARAGLQQDDVLLRIGTHEMASQADLQTAMEAHLPGESTTLLIERNGKQLEIPFTFGARPDGQPSFGVSLAVLAASDGPTTSDRVTREECVAWARATYRVEDAAQDLGLELAEDIARLQSCHPRDLEGMASPMPRTWCDNSFKIHCSGIDVLTEIGETLTERCGEILGQRLDSCASQRVFDAYTREGKMSDEAACRSAVTSCLDQSR